MLRTKVLLVSRYLDKKKKKKKKRKGKGKRKEKTRAEQFTKKRRIKGRRRGLLKFLEFLNLDREI